MSIKQDHGTPIFATDDGTSSAVATISGVAGKTYYITDISGSSDLATGLITVTSSSTVIWQGFLGLSGVFNQSFQQPLTCIEGQSVTVTVTGTAACYANFAGFSYTK